jgi:hypothetical protein
MMETQRLYMIHKNKALIYFMTDTKITRIQRAFRKRYKDPEVRRDNNKTNIIMALRLRCAMFRYSTYHKAMDRCGGFFTYIIQVLRLRTTFTKYQGYIENIQKRWRTHLKLKKDAREHLENVWAKQVMFMVESGEAFKTDYGITFNMENLKYISADIKHAIFDHIINTQILLYVDKKFEVIEKIADLELENKAKILNSANQDDRSSHNAALYLRDTLDLFDSQKDILSPSRKYFYHNFNPKKVINGSKYPKIELHQSEVRLLHKNYAREA